MSNRNPNDLDFYPVDERLILGDTRKNPFSTKPNSANDDLYLFWYKDRIINIPHFDLVTVDTIYKMKDFFSQCTRIFVSLDPVTNEYKISTE